MRPSHWEMNTSPNFHLWILNLRISWTVTRKSIENVSKTWRGNSMKKMLKSRIKLESSMLSLNSNLMISEGSSMKIKSVLKDVWLSRRPDLIQSLTKWWKNMSNWSMSSRMIMKTTWTSSTMKENQLSSKS